MPAVYDNPDTGCREIYVHGHLVTYYTEEDLTRVVSVSPIQEQFYTYAKSFGPYREGTAYDDPHHLPVDPLATELHPDDTRRTIGH
jgi:hypothetical protein